MTNFGEEVERKPLGDLLSLQERAFVHGSEEPKALEHSKAHVAENDSEDTVFSGVPSVTKASTVTKSFVPTTRRKGIVVHADGRESRRFVMYVPVPLAERVSILAAKSGRDLSHIGSEALETYLRLLGA